MYEATPNRSEKAEAPIQTFYPDETALVASG